MRKVAALAAVLLTFTIGAVDVEAKRLGSARSSGYSGSPPSRRRPRRSPVHLARLLLLVRQRKPVPLRRQLHPPHPQLPPRQSAAGPPRSRASLPDWGWLHWLRTWASETCLPTSC